MIARQKPEPVIVLCKTRLLRMNASSFVEGVENLSLKRKLTENHFTTEEAIDKITTEDNDDEESSKSEGQSNKPPSDDSVLDKIHSNKVKPREKSKLGKAKTIDHDDMAIMLSYTEPAQNSHESQSLWSAMTSNQW